MQNSVDQKTMRVCCLYQCSGGGQVGKDDLSMQKAVCKNFIETKRWMLSNEVLAKAVSQNRDALQEIQRNAIAGNFDILLVSKLDCIGHSEDETPFMLEWFARHGVVVWSVQEGEQRLDCYMDAVTSCIYSWLDDSEKTSRDIKKKEQPMLSKYLLFGKLICFECGRRLTTTIHTDRYTKQDGTVSMNKSRRYICYHGTGNPRSCCGQVSYKADKLEEIVMNALIRVFQQFHNIPQESAPSSELLQLEDWVKEFELCSLERKQVIIWNLVDRIEVGHGYAIRIHFNAAFEPFLETA